MQELFQAKSQRIIVELPIIYLCQMLAFPKVSEILVGDFKKVNFSFDNKEYKLVMDKRYGLLERQVDFLNRNSFNKGRGFMIFYYPYKTDLIRRIYYWLVEKELALGVENYEKA